MAAVSVATRSVERVTHGAVARCGVSQPLCHFRRATLFTGRICEKWLQDGGRSVSSSSNSTRHISADRARVFSTSSTSRPPPPPPALHHTQPPPPPPKAAPACSSTSKVQYSYPVGGSDPLTSQLLELDATLIPTGEQHARKQWVAETLKPLFERHTGGTLHLFGSCENGFWMNGSDIDACLVVKRCTQRPSWFTKLRLVQNLVERDRLGSVQVVRAARVPVAKIHDNEGTELCDVSVNNVAALENSFFVKALAHLDPRVPILGRFIKHWASQRRINNRSEGTLSTYTLILQLFFFLQTRELPLLPLVSDLLAARPENAAGSKATTASSTSLEVRQCVNASAAGPEMDDSLGVLRPLLFITDSQVINQEIFAKVGLNEDSVGSLLHGFFKFWGHEEFRGGDEGSGQTALVYDGTRDLNDLGVLVMRCPLTGKNVNPFTASVWRAIHGEFERAATLLLRGCSLEELCEAAEESPVGRGPRPWL